MSNLRCSEPGGGGVARTTNAAHPASYDVPWPVRPDICHRARAVLSERGKRHAAFNFFKRCGELTHAQNNGVRLLVHDANDMQESGRQLS